MSCRTATWWSSASTSSPSPGSGSFRILPVVMPLAEVNGSDRFHLVCGTISTARVELGCQCSQRNILCANGCLHPGLGAVIEARAGRRFSSGGSSFHTTSVGTFIAPVWIERIGSRIVR